MSQQFPVVVKRPGVQAKTKQSLIPLYRIFGGAGTTHRVELGRGAVRSVQGD